MDTLFFANPSSTCGEGRLEIFVVGEGGKRLDEVCSAQLPPKTMVPEDHAGERQLYRMFNRVCLELDPAQRAGQGETA